MKSARVPALALGTLVGALGACAQGGTGLQPDADVVDPGRVDAGVRLVDAFRPDAPPPDAFVPDAFVPDAFVPPMSDASVPMVDAMPDAPPDACVPVNRQLLVNPVLDASPVGTGWRELPYDPAYPLITTLGALPEHTAPYKAWLGGIEGGTSRAVDVLYQDVAIPAGTTQLVLTGYYYVATDESPTSSTAWDTATISVTRTDGSTIQLVRTLSNLTPTTAWTAFSHTFTQDLAGQTVRVRFQSSNDFLDPTSFWFDTLALTATGCP